LKVILIHPPFFSGSTWGDFRQVGAYNPPLWLCYLAAVLRENQIQVKIVDAYVLRLSIDEIVKEIKAYQADIIGITSASILFEDVKKLASVIKSIFNIPLLLGGPHVTIFPEDAMQCGLFDVGVIGEGEETIVELVRYFQNRTRIEDVKGIVYFRSGKLKKTLARPPIRTLDDLPMPTLDLLPPLNHYFPQAFTYRRRPVGYVLTSRGCPFSCIYCVRIMGNRFRAHSPERIVSEIERLISKFGVKEIHFSDDCFTVDKKRIKELCNLILEKKLKFTWKCITHVNSLDFELLKKMKAAGCWYLGVGVETGDHRMMGFIKKNIDLDHLKKVVYWACSLRIAVKGFFILGFPSETRASLNRTIAFSENIPFFAASFNIAYLNRGSEMDKIADQFGTVYRQSANVTAYSDKMSFVPYGFTAQDLSRLQRQAYLRFYLRPRQLLIMLRLNRNLENYLRAFSTVLALLRRIIGEKFRELKAKSD